ncbi:MAG TPA: hypothetical protein VJ866_12220 [Pyrinomonadaceae bacterium]|nr:hypothetical protein [Pyrinomonadaceae bacterium]
MASRAKKVVSLEAQKQAAQLREAEKMAEAMAKDNPSREAREWVDNKFETDPSWRKYGDLTAEALERGLKDFWLGYVTKKGVMIAAEDLKAELSYEDASAAERMMIDHAVMCYTRLGMIELLYSRNTSGRMDVAEHWEKRLTLAQKRYTRAVLTLARVRALLARAEQAKAAASRARTAGSLAVLKQMTG